MVTKKIGIFAVFLLLGQFPNSARADVVINILGTIYGIPKVLVNHDLAKGPALRLDFKRCDLYVLVPNPENGASKPERVCIETTLDGKTSQAAGVENADTLVGNFQGSVVVLKGVEIKGALLLQDKTALPDSLSPVRLRIVPNDNTQYKNLWSIQMGDTIVDSNGNKGIQLNPTSVNEKASTITNAKGLLTFDATYENTIPYGK